jgi:OOP family OmpA-OmpF porin
MRLGALLFASICLVEGVCRAAPFPSLDLREFHPPVDPGGFLYLEPARTPGPWKWNFGAYASYALSPVVLRAPGGDSVAKVISHQASIDYYANVGLGDRWAFGLALPTIVYQTGDDVRGLLPGSTELRHETIGALAVDLKNTLISPSELGGFGLAGLWTLYIPTDPTSYASDRSWRGEVRALGELDLLAIAVRATAGLRVRGEEQTFLRDGTDHARFGHDIPWGVGVTVRPQALGLDRGGHFRWTAEVHGAIAAPPNFALAAASPVLVGLSARYTTGDFSGLLGVELPANGAVGNPVVRPVLGLGWVPRFEDADDDGIEDDADQCPELAEDKDGVDDQDGCPDIDDGDDDGVSDDQDRCPKEPEDVDDFEDEDGCPDPDNDKDGILDAVDKCPGEAGPKTGDRPGCPDPDRDHDGVANEKDKCPDQPEDADGFQDDDGCPDPDNDKDGVLDAADACPLEAGEPNPASPDSNGCPRLDHDGDTYDDAADQCPSEPEAFNGVKDADGCPEEKPGAPLVVIEEVKGQKRVRFRIAPRIVNDDVDPLTLPSLRALGQILNAHPDWIVAVGARANGHTAEAEQTALNHAFAVALTLRWLTHRDGAAETVGWGAVKDQPGAAASGLGVLLLAPREGAAKPPGPADAATKGPDGANPSSAPPPETPAPGQNAPHAPEPRHVKRPVTGTPPATAPSAPGGK